MRFYLGILLFLLIMVSVVAESVQKPQPTPIQRDAGSLSPLDIPDGTASVSGDEGVTPAENGEGVDFDSLDQLIADGGDTYEDLENGNINNKGELTSGQKATRSDTEKPQTLSDFVISQTTPEETHVSAKEAEIGPDKLYQLENGIIQSNGDGYAEKLGRYSHKTQGKSIEVSGGDGFSWSTNPETGDLKVEVDKVQKFAVKTEEGGFELNNGEGVSLNGNTFRMDSADSLVLNNVQNSMLEDFNGNLKTKIYEVGKAESIKSNCFEANDVKNSKIIINDEIAIHTEEDNDYRQ